MNEIIRDASRKRKAYLCSRIRELRKKRGWTHADLRAAMKELYGEEISNSQLSRIENMQSPINTDKLQAVSLAFDVPLSTFFLPSVPQFCIMRHQAMTDKVTEISPGKTHGRCLHLDAELLTRPNDWGGDILAHKRMHPYFLQLKPVSDQDMRSGLDAHSGEEILQVTDGKVEVWLWQISDGFRGINRVVLKPGDNLHLKSELLHCYRAAIGQASALLIHSDIKANPAPLVTLI